MARRDDFPSRSFMLRTVFCLMLCSLGFSGNAGASTLTVNTTADSSDATGSCGTGTCSLRDAITQAAASDTIQFSVTGTITLGSALPAIAENLTITGPGAANLTVSGGKSTTVGTIFTIDSGVTASISGLTITNGNSTANGGGILNKGTLTIADCIFSGNSAADFGGGIANSGTLTVTNSTFSGNSTTAGGGGGAGIYTNSAANVTSSTFSGNSPALDGGGIAVDTGGSLTVTNSTFSANSATTGGGAGIYTQGTSLVVTNCTFFGNSSQTAGAALANNAGTMTVANSILSEDNQGGECFGNGCPTNGSDGNVVGIAANLAPLGNYGGPTQTMLPLPDSPAICAGNKTGAPSTDQRGFQVGASSYCSGKIDSGSVQTNYTAIQFTNKGASGYTAEANSAVSIPAAPNISVTENGLNQGGVPVTLTFVGTGNAAGLGPVATMAGSGATFSNITVSAAGSDTLDASLTPGSGTFTDSANLKIVQITLTPAAGTLPGATQGMSYALTFIASGGTTSTYTYVLNITSGVMPAGLSFNAPTATLSGTPTATGTVTFTVTATDGNSFAGHQSYTLTVAAPVTATTSIPATVLTVNQAAPSFKPVTVSGGSTPFTYTVSPSLPAGLNMDQTTGAITGTPTAASVQTTYTVTVTDRNSSTGSAKFSLTVNAALTATGPTSPIMLTVNQSTVSLTPVTVSGGSTPFTYALSPSTLPAGLTFSSSAGTITGIPTAASTQTTYTLTVTDSAQAKASANFSLTVNGALTVTGPTAPLMLTVNQPSASIAPVTVSGGSTPFTYSISPTSLPAGLNFSSSSGTITGVPTASSMQATYTVTVTDSNKVTKTANFSLSVNNKVVATRAIPTTTLTVNQPSASFIPVTGSGGTGTRTFSISPSSLPAGLSFSSSSGAITGMPTAASPAQSYTVTVTDSNNATDVASFSLTVSNKVTATGPTAPIMLTVNQPSASVKPVTGSGGTGTLTYSISPSALPAGLSFSSSSGTITGVPAAASAAASYTVTITDSNLATGAATFTLTVNNPVTATLVIATEALTVSQPSTSFTPVTGSGGTGTRTYSISSPLPAGLTLNSATGSISGAPTAPSAAMSYTITVTDTNGATDTKSFSLTVNNKVTATLATATETLTVSQAGSFTPVTGSGGTGTLTYSISSTLPTGLTLNQQTGTISGTPTAASPATTYTITVTDSNQAKATATFTLTIQDLSLLLSSNGPVTVSAGFTNTSDPVLPQATVTVTATSFFGFATQADHALVLNCTFGVLSAPDGATVPSCPTTMLAVSALAGGQASLTIDATNATPGLYSLVVTGVDPTTGITRSTQQFTVYVSFITTTPLSVTSGSSTNTTFNFTLPAGLVLPINCNYALIVSSTTPAPTSSIPIGCTLSATTIGSASSTTVQSIPVTVTINAGLNVSELASKTNVFLAGLLGVPILALIGWLSRGKKSGRNLVRFLGLAFVLALVLQNVGCGGSFNRAATPTNTTPVGSYYLIVQGPGGGDTTKPYSKQPYQAVIQVNVGR